jgi:S1-C subfamily serine protease
MKINTLHIFLGLLLGLLGQTFSSIAQTPKDLGLLGLKLSPVTEEAKQKLSAPTTNGVWIMDIIPGSSAEASGVKKDDIILKVKDTEITKIDEFMTERRKYAAGEVMVLGILRNGKQITIKVKLKPMPFHVITLPAQ